MGINLKKISKIARKSLSLALVFVFLVSLQVIAATTPTFNQTITAGALSVDIVDAGGTTVGSPSVTFASKAFSFDTQTSTGDFAPSAQRIRVSNPTGTAAWTVNLAGSAPGAHWTAGGNTYHFDDATGGGATNGQMTVDPSGGTISGVSGCATTNTSKGSVDSFASGSVDSIDIFSSTTAATYCRFDYVGAVANISQKIPASQAAGSYSLTMSVTVQ